MLNKLFEELRNNKKKFMNSSDGKQFENRIMVCLESVHFNPIYKDMFDTKELKEEYAKIKKMIINKKSDAFVTNTVKDKFKNKYIYQPYGSQNFPDFLIFTEEHIVALEIKYATKMAKCPMWNSNLPKANAFYIFGSYNLGDIMFFYGNDILPQEERIMLLNFFDDIKKAEDEFKSKVKELYNKEKIKNDKGFMVYVRKAYSQGKQINKFAETDYFNFTNRKELEDNVIKISSNI